jgi:hypothetical protein
MFRLQTAGNPSKSVPSVAVVRGQRAGNPKGNAILSRNARCPWSSVNLRHYAVKAFAYSFLQGFLPLSLSFLCLWHASQRKRLRSMVFGRRRVQLPLVPPPCALPRAKHRGGVAPHSVRNSENAKQIDYSFVKGQAGQARAVAPR